MATRFPCRAMHQPGRMRNDNPFSLRLAADVAAHWPPTSGSDREKKTAGLFDLRSSGLGRASMPGVKRCDRLTAAAAAGGRTQQQLDSQQPDYAADRAHSRQLAHATLVAEVA